MNTVSNDNDPKLLVEQGYDKVALKYARLEADSEWPRMQWLRKMLIKLKPGASILDLGCGSGDPADIEIAKKHKVTGVDVSLAQIELARQYVPAGHFHHGDAGTIDFPPTTFEAVVSFYTIEHIPRQEHGALLQRIHRWLRPGGFFLLSTEADDVEGVVGQWLSVPMYFSSYDAETLKLMVIEQGFEIVETASESQIEQGHEIQYLWILARKV